MYSLSKIGLVHKLVNKEYDIFSRICKCFPGYIGICSFEKRSTRFCEFSVTYFSKRRHFGTMTPGGILVG